MFTILYVDDEPGLLEIGKLFLEQNGQFSVETITSAIKALEVLRSGHYDAIISDYQMPGMDGIEFLKRVRASGNTIPFIIFTGRGREEVVIQALNEGADFYLQKGGEPVSQFTELTHKVRQAVQQRMAEASIRDHERREADIINFLPDATFAIDTRGVVIAWNRAMEMMTGVKASQVLRKSNYEYALPFYHERRPILIDLVLTEDPDTVARYPYIKHDGKTLFSEITIPHFHDGRGAALWFTASPLYDTAGKIVGAIESIREITEWKRAEEALNESERRFRELADMLPQIVFEADAQGVLTYANRIAFETFGYTVDEFRQGLTVMQMIAPDDRKRAAAAIRTILEGKGITARVTEEYLALRKDGSTFPVAIYSSPVFTHDRITGLRGIIVDITERRRAEDAIRESEQKYRTVFETTGTATVLVENDGTISLANSEFENLSGYKKDELKGRHKWMEFVVPEDLDHMLAQHRLRRIDRRKALTHYEFRFRRRSGEVRDIYLTIDVIPDTTRSVASLLDITERKKAEDRLVAASNEYENLLDQIQDIYYRSDAEGRLVRASRSWATLLGYDDISECIGRSIADDFYINPPDRKRFLEEVNREGKVTNYEVLLKKKDGTPVLVSTSSHITTADTGKVIGVEGIFRDITERKRTEEALRESEQRYLNIIEDQTEFICRFRPDGTHVLVNEAYCRYFGLEREELIGHRFRPDIPPEDRGMVKQFFSSLTPDHPVDSIVHRIIMTDGRVRWQRWSDRAIFGSAGDIIEYQSVGRDVTETKEVEAALRESEERFRTILDTTSEWIWEIGLDGRHTYSNPAVESLLGYTPEEIRNPDAFDLMHPEDRERIKTIFSSCVKERKGWRDLVVRWRHRDGTYRYLESNAEPVFNDQGGLTGFQGADRDITDRRHAEEALLESEARYRSLAEASQDLIFVIDKNDHVVYVNNSAAAMFVIPASGVTGKKRKDLFPADVSKGQLKAIQKVLRTRKGFRSTGKLSFGGRVFWFDHSLMPIRDASGAVTRVLGVSRDITEQKKTEEELRRKTEDLDSRSRLISTLLETVPIGIFMVEAPSGKPIIANNEATRLLGRGILPEATAGTLTDIYDAYRAGTNQRYPTNEMPVVRGLHGESCHADDMVVVRPDGSNVQLEVFGTPVTDSRGRVTASLVSFLDITERKRTEQVIREANKKIGLLTSITRHDVANRVAALRGFAGVAMMMKPSPGIAELLAKIDSAAAAIAQQIEFTRAYQELSMHIPDWHRISEIIAAQEADKISLSCTCDAEVFADPMLERVFFNLIENAVRHGERVTAIRVSCQQGPDESLVITVEDNGCGVAPERKEMIFEKGYGKHTGFGLFLAREILAITGITIRETGTSGKGAQFEITVPKGTYRIDS